jgi:hypothetical protein
MHRYSKDFPDSTTTTETESSAVDNREMRLKKQSQILSNINKQQDDMTLTNLVIARILWTCIDD